MQEWILSIPGTTLAVKFYFWPMDLLQRKKNVSPPDRSPCSQPSHEITGFFLLGFLRTEQHAEFILSESDRAISGR